MRKRFFSILTALALCLTLLPTAALADGTDDIGGAAAVQSAPQTQTAGGAAAYAASPTGTALTQETISIYKVNRDTCIVLPEGAYYLDSDIYLVGDDADPNSAWPLNITARDVTIDLNGHVLDLQGSFIYVTGNLTLKDSNTEGRTHKFSKETDGLWKLNETEGTETVNGGVIIGGSHIDTTLGYGGGVAVASGTFTMEGGSIVGCTAAYGGGVAVTNGTFHMTGGSISGCTATNGGGVYVGGGTFTMEGGSIEECKATNGGGVYVGGGTFTMEGGSIESCTATDGGGVYVNNIGGSGTFTMEGGSISGCTATDGGGVYQGSGTFTMKGGSIESCTATDGGGVYVETYMIFTMENGSIEGCTADRNGGGVYVDCSVGASSRAYGTFTMNGGSITNCKVKVGSGENDDMLNAVHADGTFTDNNTTKIDKSLLSGIHAGHEGNSGDPILISSVEGLKDFRDRVNGTGSYTSVGAKPNLCATLTRDIVLNDGTFGENGTYKNARGESSAAEQWTPIGSGISEYTGTFNGNGHTIQGLYINSDQSYIGLFGSVKNATIKNLTVTGYVKGGSSTGGAVGGFAGSAEKSTIQNCTNRSNVTGTYQVGGLVGVFDQGSIQNCANLGKVEGTGDYIGGIVGYTVNSTTMTACYNAGEVKGTSCVGGLLGFGALETTSCYNVGNVMGTGHIGGLVGGEALHNGSSLLTVDNCYYLDTAAEKALGKAEHFEGDTSTWRKTKTEFANGEVLALLKQNDATNAWADECGYLAAAGLTLPVFKGQGDSHKHDFEWKHTDTEHWQECVCGATQNRDAHSGGSVCSVCGKVLRSSSTGGSSSRPGYTVTVEKSTNGAVSADRRTASRGTTVTITVTPDKGYTLETITVLDKNGNELKLTQKNGKYTFTMPSGSVTITATFMDDNTMLNFFVDVKASDYYYDAVLWAAQNGVTSGTDAVHFSPDQPCTRAQIVTFLWRAAGCPVVNYAMNMTDVPEDAYYAEAVRWALSLGITTGTTATTFSPDETCTRAQAVSFLFRYAAPAAVTLQELVSGFSDAASVPGYALPAMNWALAEGIVQGDGSKLLPNDSCTRAQIVTFLYRTLAK